VTGRLQSDQGVIHIVAERMEDWSMHLAKLSAEPLGQGGIARADEVRRPVEEHRQKVKSGSRLTRMIASDPDIADDIRKLGKAASVLPKGRNFQ
jgi:error-prone DNA polymerase